MDEPDLFSDFNLEEIQEKMGIAPALVDSNNVESSSIKSENYSEKGDEKENEPIDTPTGSNQTPKDKTHHNKDQDEQENIDTR